MKSYNFMMHIIFCIVSYRIPQKTKEKNSHIHRHAGDGNEEEGKIKILKFFTRCVEA